MAPNPASAGREHSAPATPLPSLAGESLLPVLRLARTARVGPVTFFQLIRRFGSAEAALVRLPEMARRGGGALVPCSVAEAEKEILATEKHGARLLRYGEADYPPLLLHIADAPPVLAVHGNAALWRGRDCVAMVGARNASANGCGFAQKLAREIAGAGVTVISGLARGIDSFAHKGALENGTAGVIAGGIDTVYPPENAALFAQLRERGAVISEQPFGQAPFAGSFPGRNRIIAGMSRVTVVVEASLKSGSLITARNALDYGRDVAAVPGFPLDPRATGPNSLLKDGATLIQSATEILELLHAPRPMRLEECAPSPFAAQLPEPDEQTLAAARRTVREKLGPVAVSVEELLAQCELTPALLLTVLMELDLAGAIRRERGNRVCLAIT